MERRKDPSPPSFRLPVGGRAGRARAVSDPGDRDTTLDAVDRWQNDAVLGGELASRLQLRAHQVQYRVRSSRRQAAPHRAADLTGGDGVEEVSDRLRPVLGSERAVEGAEEDPGDGVGGHRSCQQVVVVPDSCDPGASALPTSTGIA